MDSVAKFGEVLSRGTYPVTVNEVGALNDDRLRPLVEMFKNAIETQTARSKFVRKVSYTEILLYLPAYSQAIRSHYLTQDTDEE
jgi:hypothetical protein